MATGEFLLFLLSFSFSFSLSTSQSQQQYQEAQILLQIKSLWNNPPSLASWTNSSTSNSSSHCDWFGITCTDGVVTAIALQNQAISGAVPSTTCNLRNISSLDLRNNSIGGNFQTSLYLCSNLRYLDLSQNYLVGPIPNDIDRLPRNLAYLNLAGNNLVGEIPSVIAKFPSLRRLFLDNNLFNGSTPVEIGNMSSLERLTLAVNPFDPGAVPVGLRKLKKLKFLWISHANLVGEIPVWFGEFAELEYLDLSSNSLNGGLPAGIWGLRNLKSLFLYANNLQGGIPSTVGALGLERVDLSINEMNGSVPEDFGKLENLTWLFLYNNRFSGEIPDGIGRIPKLIDIRLFNNNFSGRLPAELGKHSMLWNVEVPNNMFSGELPPSLCQNQNLNSVVVFSNNLTGDIPEALGDCPTLINIQLQENGFSGNFPPRLWSSAVGLSTVIASENGLSGELPRRLPWNLSRLELSNNKFYGLVPSIGRRLFVFKASNNMFSGELPSDLSGLSNLQELWLDGNKILGTIPTSIGSLSSLTDLDLSGNQLTGEIPNEIGSSTVLTFLDLSNNHLSGNIPIAIGNLRLISLNLSSNSLTGEVPSTLQNTAYSRSFLSNPGLCSSDPQQNLPPCASDSKKSDELSKGLLVLFLVLGVIIFLVAIFFLLMVARDIRKRRKHGGNISNWKLTSFQSLGFTGTSIIGGLTAENLIGYGGSGQVYRVAVGNDNDEAVAVAVKKIWNANELEPMVEKEFQVEVEILGSIRHRNIVKLLCCISSSDLRLLVYEYMKNGSLDHWLHGRRRTMGTSTSPIGLDWPTRLRIAVGAAQGLSYMHHDCDPLVVHRDVKSSNILLDSEFNAKVADFGLAKLLIEHGGFDATSRVIGSVGYMAPERAYKRKVNEKVDVYGFGVVLLELATGKNANEGRNCTLVEWVWRHFKEGRPEIDVVDEEIRDPTYEEEMTTVVRLGLMCTGTLPSTRPSMKVVLETLLRCANAPKHDDKGDLERDMAPLLRTNNRSHRKIHSSGGGNDNNNIACNV